MPDAAVGAAAIPSAPLMLPAVAPRVQADLAGDLQVLRDAAARALEPLGDGGPAVLLATDDAPGPAAGRVLAPDRVDLDGLGVAGSGRSLVGDGHLAERLVAGGLLPEPEPGPRDVPVDLASLALQVAAAREDRPLALVALSPAADPAAVADLLGGALEGGEALVAAGDLSAGLGTGSPRPDLDGAAAFDRSVVAALKAGDGPALAALGNPTARRLHARGWLPLAVAQHWYDDTPGQVVYRSLRGVGQVVAAWGSGDRAA